MKRFAAAVLGLALSFSMAPAVQAQSLNFGSLGATQPEEDSIKDWTEGVDFQIRATVERNAPYVDYCEIHFYLNRMSAYDIPRGHIGWVDLATGRTEQQAGNLAPGDWSVPIMGYPSSNWGYNVDFVNYELDYTFREMSFFIIEEGTNERIELGSESIRFERSCPVPDNLTGTATQNGTLYP